MKHSDSFATLAAALVAAQGEIRAVGKDRENTHFRNKYATLDAIVESVRPVLATHGLAILQGAVSPQSDDAGVLRAFHVETMLVHKSGEWMSNSILMPIAKLDPQGAGAALTYGRRYGLSSLLSLATDDDDDGNAASNVGQKRQAPRTREAAPARPASAPVPNDGVRRWPYGKRKGEPLSDFTDDQLAKALAWAQENQKEDAATMCLAEQNDRAGRVA